jgi:hypothetical protein
MSQTISKSALDNFGASIQSGETMPAVAMAPHALAILSRSEIDAQMASAGTRPRDPRQFRDSVQAIALMNEEAAADCHYALPARKEDGEPIEGPSIRFAEILAYAWGNCRVGARVIDEATDHVTAQGIFSDVEKNTVSTFEVRRRITDRRGRRYSLDMINVTANAACSIARRNAILQAIPKPLWADLYEEAREMAAGSAAELGPRRDKAIGAFKDLGVSEPRILAMLGVERADQIDLDRLGRLRGIYTAVKDGAVTIKDLEPPSDSKAAGEKTTSALDAFAAGAVNSQDPAAPSADHPPAPAMPDEGGGEGLQQASAAADDPAIMRQAAINEAMQLAGRADLEPDDKLEQLDLMKMSLTDRFSDQPGFVKTLIETAVKVVRKELPKAAATKYLASLKDG